MDFESDFSGYFSSSRTGWLIEKFDRMKEFRKLKVGIQNRKRMSNMAWKIC